MKNLHISIRKSSIWVIARFFVSLSVGVFITTFIIRSLTVEEYGLYTILFSLITYVSVISSFGIVEVFRRFIPEAMQASNYSLLKGLVLRGLVLRIVLSALTVSVILLVHGPVGQLLKIPDFINYFSVFAFGIVLYLEATLLTSVLHSLFLHKYSVIASTIYTLFRGACVFLLLKLGWDILGVLWAEVASWGLWTILQWLLYHFKFSKVHPTSKVAKLPVRRYLRYAGFSSLNELGSAALGVSTDFFIISAALGPSAVAIYAFADRVIKLFMSCMPHVLLIDVIRPSFFTKYAETGSKQHLNQMFNLLVKIGAFSVFPLVVGIFLLGDTMIVLVFKPEYLPAEKILWVLIIFTAINIFAFPTGLVLQALEQVQINLYSKVFAIFNVIAALLVVHRFGVMGVVLTTCLSGLMKNLYCYWYAKQYGELSVDWPGLVRIATNAALMSVLLYFARPFVDNLLSLLVVATAGTLMFLVASWANKGFTSQERLWINRIMPRPLFVF